jgi:hypothetical protein
MRLALPPPWLLIAHFLHPPLLLWLSITSLVTGHGLSRPEAREPAIGCDRILEDG